MHRSRKREGVYGNAEMSALDVYTNRVYKIVVLIIPVFCLIARTFSGRTNNVMNPSAW